MKPGALHTAGGRVALTVIAVPVGWLVGVYAFFGLLYLFDDGPKPGAMHVGALFLGLAGMVVLPLAAWRLSACLPSSEE